MIYRIGLQFIEEDECLIEAKNKKEAIKKAKQLYRNRAVVKASKDDLWSIDPNMLDPISEREIQ